jgi:hypothetical protein
MAALGDTAGFLIVETGVFVAEAAVYRFLVPASWGRALVLSFAANASSAAAGVVLSAFNLLGPA